MQFNRTGVPQIPDFDGFSTSMWIYLWMCGLCGLALRCLQCKETKPGRVKKHWGNREANLNSLSHYCTLPFKCRIRRQMGVRSKIHMFPLQNLTEHSLKCVCGINQMSGKHYTFVMWISSVATANTELFHYKLWCYEFNIPSWEKNPPILGWMYVESYCKCTYLDSNSVALTKNIFTAALKINRGKYISNLGKD